MKCYAHKKWEKNVFWARKIIKIKCEDDNQCEISFIQISSFSLFFFTERLFKGGSYTTHRDIALSWHRKKEMGVVKFLKQKLIEKLDV